MLFLLIFQYLPLNFVGFKIKRTDILNFAMTFNKTKNFIP
jgi:hypothetical protein